MRFFYVIIKQATLASYFIIVKEIFDILLNKLLGKNLDYPKIINTILFISGGGFGEVFAIQAMAFTFSLLLGTVFQYFISLSKYVADFIIVNMSIKLLLVFFIDFKIFITKFY